VGIEVGVELADDDPGMIRLLLVKADEMQAIQGEHRPALTRRKGQHLSVGQGLSALPAS
jgi:hypothetical protein